MQTSREHSRGPSWRRAPSAEQTKTPPLWRVLLSLLAVFAFAEVPHSATGGSTGYGQAVLGAGHAGKAVEASALAAGATEEVASEARRILVQMLAADGSEHVTLAPLDWASRGVSIGSQQARSEPCPLGAAAACYGARAPPVVA